MMCGNDFLQAGHVCPFPLCFHLVVHLEAIRTDPCKINKVRRQPLSGLLGADHLLISICAERLTWTDTHSGLFCLLAYVAEPCVLLFFWLLLQFCYPAAPLSGLVCALYFD